MKKDLFADEKGHRIEPIVSKRPQNESQRRPSRTKPIKYVRDPEIRATAEFIRSMGPGTGKRKKLRFDPGIIVYAAIVIVMLLLLFWEFTTPAKTTTEVKRTITEVPVIDNGVEITAGTEPPGGNDLSGWWNVSLMTSCNGIERVYTGTNFTSDWQSMVKKYDSIYGHQDDQRTTMMPPIAMFQNVTNYDCKDAAHATRCLASKYNVTCSFWIKANLGPIVPKTEGHLGVCCKIDNGWQCI